MSDFLLWTPSNGRASAGWPARTYLQQLYTDSGCIVEYMPGAMDGQDEGRERKREWDRQRDRQRVKIKEIARRVHFIYIYIYKKDILSRQEQTGKKYGFGDCIFIRMRNYSLCFLSLLSLTLSLSIYIYIYINIFFKVRGWANLFSYN